MNGLVGLGLLLLLAIGLGLFGYAFFGGMRMADRVADRKRADRDRRLAIEAEEQAKEAQDQERARLLAGAARSRREASAEDLGL
jgi:Flp pilus assembly protein TadB